MSFKPFACLAEHSLIVSLFVVRSTDFSDELLELCICRRAGGQDLAQMAPGLKDRGARGPTTHLLGLPEALAPDRVIRLFDRQSGLLRKAVEVPLPEQEEDEDGAMA